MRTISDFLSEEKPFGWQRKELLEFLPELENSVYKTTKLLGFSYSSKIIERNYMQYIPNPIIQDYLREALYAINNALYNVFSKYPSEKKNVNYNIEAIEYDIDYTDKTDVPLIKLYVYTNTNGVFAKNIVEDLEYMHPRTLLIKKTYAESYPIIKEVQITIPLSSIQDITESEKIFSPLRGEILRRVENIKRYLDSAEKDDQVDLNCFRARVEFSHIASLVGYTPIFEDVNTWGINDNFKHIINGTGICDKFTINRVEKAMRKTYG